MRPDTASNPVAADLVKVRHADGVAHVQLNRPDALNAWTPDLGRALLSAVRTASADPGVRAILLTGAGRAFSAGADVKVPREHLPNGDIDLSVRLREIYNPIVAEIRAAPKPVVGAIQGAAAGLGCSLALSCDLLVASESAYFLLAFVHLGVIPDAGAALFLAEKVGSQRAAQLMMLGERLPASKALDWGLVSTVVPDADLRDAATALAQRLAAGPTVALASMKRTLTSAAQLRLAEHLELEATLQQTHATTEDYAEGVLSFTEKRRPQFRGR